MSPGPSRATGPAPVRDTTTVKPSPRSSAVASLTTASVSPASTITRPLLVTPTAPGSGPPCPASRNTVRFRLPRSGANSLHAPRLKYAGPTGTPAVARRAASRGRS